MTPIAQLEAVMRGCLLELARSNPHLAAEWIDLHLDPLDDSPDMIALYRAANALDRCNPTDATTILHGALAVKEKQKPKDQKA